MINFPFENYEDFKTIFGKRVHNNGVVTRDNNILLQYYRDKEFRRYVRKLEADGYVRAGELLKIRNMAQLKSAILPWILRVRPDDDARRTIDFGDDYPNLYNKRFKTDEYKGICMDGTSGITEDGRIRVVFLDDREKVVKIKAGKLFREIMDSTEFGRMVPEQVKVWLAEQFVEEWKAYSSTKSVNAYELHVDKDFERIYDGECLEGDFHSCMVDEDQYHFYEDAVNASAAYLTNQDNMVVARAIIFNKVVDEDGKVWRLCERQYSTDIDLILQRMLVQKLIAGGHIDGYKQIGAGCSDSQAFVGNDGNSLFHMRFHIVCNLEPGETLSYQDSFKWYDYKNNTAYNFRPDFSCLDLSTTADTLEDLAYDEYHDCYCNSVTTVYVEEGRSMDCDSDDLDDFVWVNGMDAYCLESETGICPHCGAMLYIHSDEACYSDLLDQTFCCDDCRTAAEDEYKKDRPWDTYHDCEVDDEDDLVDVWYAGDKVTCDRNNLDDFETFTDADGDDIFVHRNSLFICEECGNLHVDCFSVHIREAVRPIMKWGKTFCCMECAVKNGRRMAKEHNWDAFKKIFVDAPTQLVLVKRGGCYRPIPAEVPDSPSMLSSMVLRGKDILVPNRLIETDPVTGESFVCADVPGFNSIVYSRVTGKNYVSRQTRLQDERKFAKTHVWSSLERRWFPKDTEMAIIANAYGIVHTVSMEYIAGSNYESVTLKGKKMYISPYITSHCFTCGTIIPRVSIKGYYDTIEDEAGHRYCSDECMAANQTAEAV